jgi:hypothetical protein
MTIPKITELEWKTHPAGIGGECSSVDFENGYTASTIKGGPFYTKGGTYEIAIVHGGHICYDTGLTDGVFGYLNEAEANKALADIAALPVRRNQNP